MVIKITLGEIIDKYNWKKFCDISGTNEWCLNEGIASSDDTILMTEEEFEQIKYG